MKYLTSLLLLLCLHGLSAQVGIGTSNPKATLHIQSSSKSFPSETDGLLIPKINDFPTTNPGIEQEGMLVFVTGEGAPSKGFYFWSNTLSKWSLVKTSENAVEKIDDLKDAKTNRSGTSLFLGTDAGHNDTAGNNVGVGYAALKNNSNGLMNTAVGMQALANNTTGSRNSAYGGLSQFNNTTGNDNTTLGVFSMFSNRNGYGNSAMGAFTLALNTEGFLNMAVGYSSLSSNTTGHLNTALGAQSLRSNTTGVNNLALGAKALFRNGTGSYNIGIGTLAGENNNGSRNIFIGLESGKNDLAGNDRLYIENSASGTPLIGGDFSLNKVGINRSISSLTNTFEVGGTASKATPGDWLANSDRRLKKNISYLKGSDVLDKIAQLKGISYEWNDAKTGIKRPEGIQYGFIAQELMEVFPEKVTVDANGYYQTAYGEYDPFYVEAIKELKKEMDKKQVIIEELIKRIEKLENTLSSKKYNTYSPKVLPK